MNAADEIQINLIKLANGERLLRLVDLPTGLTLEKQLDRQRSVARQKEQLFGILKAALLQARLTTA